MRTKAVLPNFRISTKLLLLNVMICAAFVLIICVTIFSFTYVWNMLKEVVDKDMGRVISNSQTGRELSKLFTDIDLLNRTFYGNNNDLESERKRLLSTVKSIAENTSDRIIDKPLLSLANHLESFLSQCAVVNTAFHARETIDRETLMDLTKLESMIGEFLVNLTLEGRDTSFVEQQLMLVIGYRESLLQIGKLFAEQRPEHYVTPPEGKTCPVILAIDDLILRLHTITASIPDVAKSGKSLIRKFQKYKEIIRGFNKTMEELGLRRANLNHSKTMSMSAMATIDKKVSGTTKLVNDSIEKTILSSGAAVLMLSIIVIITLGLATTYIIRSNINNPMNVILKGIETFRKGKFETQIELGRKDEWGTIEKAFNNMASDLSRSYDELEQRVNERTAELTNVNKEMVEEIEERKRIEEALQKSEEKYRTILQSIEDNYFELDIAGNFTFFNDATCRLLQYSKDELMGMNNRQYMDKENAKKVFKTFNQIFTTGKPSKGFDYEIIRKDGSKGNIEVATSLIKDSEGQPVGFRGLGRDITEKKQAGEALRESEERYRTILDEIDEGYFEVDLTGTFTFVSDWFLQIAGNSKGSLLKMNNRDYMTPESAKKVLEIFTELFQTGKPVKNVEHEIITTEGEHRIHELSASLMRDREGNPIGFRGTARDVTDRVKVEEALRESEERYRLLFNNAPLGIILILDNSIRFLNRQAIDLVNYSQEDLEQEAGDNFLEFIHPDDRNIIAERYLERLAGEELPPLPPVRIITKNGEIRWVYIYSVTIPLEGKTGLLAYIVDITHQILAEQERKKLEIQFQHVQKAEAIGTLAGSVAHDFNNLLTTISMSAELALIKFVKDNRLRKIIEDIKKATQRGASLTSQLLAFSRRQVIRPNVLGLNEGLRDMGKMLGRLIGEDIELNVVLDPGLWNVKADPGQIDQVIMNLSINARDAMPKGGKLTIETSNVDLKPDYFRNHGVEVLPGPYVMLAVSDTGLGIDKKTESHIFEPFFTTKEKGKGTGLGLSTVYGIVKQSGGYIWVYSEPGQGSTFKVYLPKWEGDSDSGKKEPTPIGEVRGSETVLIVEDDDMLRNLAKKILHLYGYMGLEARDGNDALRVSEEHKGSIQLMVTDVVMPGMSGRELADRIQPLRPDMKILYMSGYTDNAIVHHQVLDPQLAFLQKPFTPEGLAGKAREVLDN